MYSYELSDKLKKVLNKLSKKDNKLYKQLLKKLEEIVNAYDIRHYKNLRHDLKDFKRIHIGSFVLIFGFDKKNNRILFDDFQHHDKVYSRR